MTVYYQVITVQNFKFVSLIVFEKINFISVTELMTHPVVYKIYYKSK